jgi:uncharacterized protein YcfJ
MEDEMKSLGKIVAATALVLSFGTGAAYADGCSGRDHTTETVLGAGAGALTGGLIGGDIAGAAVGGVAGGFIGNAIGRSQDCNRVRSSARRTPTRTAYWVDRNGHRHYYQRSASR